MQAAPSPAIYEALGKHAIAPSSGGIAQSSHNVREIRPCRFEWSFQRVRTSVYNAFARVTDQ